MTHHAPTTATWSDLSHPQRVSAVRALVATSTAQQAATALATTKSAIIGFCSRNGIALGNTVPPAAPANDNARDAFVELPPAEPFGKNVLLIDRADDGCCWPTIGHGAAQRYCGLPTSRTYCALHRKRRNAPRAGDTEFVELLIFGRLLAGKEPEVSIEEALELVRGKQKREVGE